MVPAASTRPGTCEGGSGPGGGGGEGGSGPRGGASTRPGTMGSVSARSASPPRSNRRSAIVMSSSSMRGCAGAPSGGYRSRMACPNAASPTVALSA